MHLVETMAYAGEKSWHGLGNRLAPQQTIDTWKQQAGMNWQIEASEVRYISGNHHMGVINAFPEQKVLYRSDTKAPLAVVPSTGLRRVVVLAAWIGSTSGALRKIVELGPVARP
jgi:hypothetical protein